MSRSYYSADLNEFIKHSHDEILGRITSCIEHALEETQKRAWQKQITILQNQLSSYSEGRIIFEYTIPRIGKRIDNILIINGLIFLLEFKVGGDNYYNHDIEQVMDYALDLKYFHKQSDNKTLIPILISTEAKIRTNKIEKYEDKIFKPLLCNKDNISISISKIVQKFKEEDFSSIEWENSIYQPTPTIIEAAQALYNGHDVKEISRSDAGAYNLESTSKAINKIIDDAKQNNKKAICFITGVPGAGKTLAGLNIVNERQNYNEQEHTVFLSGNFPLVEVLQEALARDNIKTSPNRITKKEALRKSSTFIQLLHHFRDEALKNNAPPLEKVIIFDEAQRAWTKKQTSNFMHRKKGVSNFNKSEPEFLIESMNRHLDWAVIICLIGGGQEINTGEAGLIEWFDSLKRSFKNWNVYISSKIFDNEHLRGRTIDGLLDGLNYKYEDALHLNTSIRSFRSEKVSDFVKSILDEEKIQAKKLYSEIYNHYKIILTRDLNKAKNWIKEHARGSERYGLIASSGALRLKPEGIWVKNDISASNWFLNSAEDIRSSYYLEDTATEFDIQGLELDWSLVAWGADFRIEKNEFIYKRFYGSKWQNVNNEDRKLFIKNAYRVLLTRARQGMIIYIPKGDIYDYTRPPEYYDETFNYLKNIGIEEI